MSVATRGAEEVDNPRLSEDHPHRRHVEFTWWYSRKNPSLFQRRCSYKMNAVRSFIQKSVATQKMTIRLFCSRENNPVLEIIQIYSAAATMLALRPSMRYTCATT